MFGAYYCGQVEPAGMREVDEVPRRGTGGGWAGGGAPVPMHRASKRPAGMIRPPWARYVDEEQFDPMPR